MQPDVVIAGAGIFGVAAALELRERGARVRLVDPGPVPHPDASSTDISKLVRADYGTDELYARFMLDAFPRWRLWNDRFGEALFHESGMLVLAREPFAEGGFERESRATLERLGARVEHLDAAAIVERFPAWQRGVYSEGYFNPLAGWVESGRVVEALAREAVRAGVEISEGARLAPLDPALDRVEALVTESGERLTAERFVVACGPHTPVVLPELSDRVRPIAQTILHFDAEDRAAFAAPRFVPWAADIARTGWYGFPSHPRAGGVVKIARHGEGLAQDPRAPRVVPDDLVPRFRAFLEASLPALAERPIVARRVCFYSDSFDGDFFIDRHPRWDNVTVASGGSGHAFKFAPLLGAWIADAVTGAAPPVDRFRWRALSATRREAARAT